ncbi:MAG: zinc ribbon domain-containing protein [Spirochaetaceae bacterium]|jgi:RNA polymerase subunit RPABC4/transcription elongation factor Spt4|nr:zinc ribbon domain-containing protein [Spirochaetaceae bacterium]
MAFCLNCGTQLQDGAKFCPSCGTPAGGAAPAQPKPAVEKVGNIRKCPACGAEVPSMTAKCPECGHEFSGMETAGSIKEFFSQIMEIDARPRPSKQRDNTFKIKAGLFLGLVGILAVVGMFWESESGLETEQIAAGIAGVVIFGLILFRPKAHFTEDDNSKKTLIENFPIPNSKEDIMEFLILASSKIAPASGFSSAALLQKEWNKIWAIKCRQVYTKADIALAGDEKSLSTINGIRGKIEKSLRQAQKQSLMINTAAAAAVIALGMLLLINTSSVFVKIPESRTWETDKIELDGVFLKHFKVVGDGVTLTPDLDLSIEDYSPKIILTMAVECISPFAPEFEKKLAEVRNSKGWKETDQCTYTQLFSRFLINQNNDSTKISENDISSMADMETGDIKTLRLIFGVGDFYRNSKEREKKEAVVKLMEQPSLIIKSAVQYQITNRTKDAAEGTSHNTWQLVEF